jgi:hypothetical protein
VESVLTLTSTGSKFVPWTVDMCQRRRARRPYRRGRRLPSESSAGLAELAGDLRRVIAPALAVIELLEKVAGRPNGLAQSDGTTGWHALTE